MKTYGSDKWNPNHGDAVLDISRGNVELFLDIQ